MNGLDCFKFAELLMFMAVKAVDCMVLINVRISQERVSFLRRAARAQLGPHAACLVSTPASQHAGEFHGIKVGGDPIVLNNRRGPQLVHHKSDPSQLSQRGRESDSPTARRLPPDSRYIKSHFRKSVILSEKRNTFHSARTFSIRLLK